MSLAIIGGAGLAFFALIGFEDSVNVAEETAGPARDYPRALFGGLLDRRASIYLAVTIVASMVVPTGRRSPAPTGRCSRSSRSGPLAIDHEGLRGDRALRGRQRRADQHDHGLAAASTACRARGSCRGLLGPRAPERGARRGWRSSFTTAIADGADLAPATSATLADMTVLLLLLVFTAREHRRARAAPRPRSTTTTSARRPRSR